MTIAVPEIAADVELWDAWSPEQVAHALSGVDAPWYVAAGWAIDLFLGEQRREHGDIEIGVPRARFGEVAEALVGIELELYVVTGGRAVDLEEAGGLLDATHQTWVRDPSSGTWVLDVLREPSHRDMWVCRRDRRIRASYSRVIEWTDGGIPYCAPEIALLFKAKEPQPKDEGDFEALLPHLAPPRREWLAGSLETAHPGHPWIQRLRAPS